MPTLDLGVVGNCAYGALIDGQGSVVWCCLPAFDGDPVFCRLLQDGGDTGYFGVSLEDGLERTEQFYLHNTAILCTRLYDTNGNGVQVTDFAPRFTMYGRRFRPPVLVRVLEAVAGAPRIRVALRPTFAYGGNQPQISHGSNHIRYAGAGATLRLTTDAPLPFILKEQPFLLQDRLTLYLGPDEPLADAVDKVGREFLERTQDYWRLWVRSLNIPLEWQEAVIRSVITLKLCSYEPTGALLAALTTSVPEAPDSGRNWDYRYCWLRDAHFTVQALNQTGAHQTMEDFLRYIDNITAASAQGTLQPVYGISLESDLTERVIESLPGYRDMGPVRAGNQAFQQMQHDVYGSVVLASTHAFFDTRLLRPAKVDDFHRLETLGEKAFALHDKPDSGIWELRNNFRVHTWSSLMCWAACDRLAKIAAHLGISERARRWREQADQVFGVITERAWNPRLKTFTGSFGGEELDASLLLLRQIGFLKGDDPRFKATVEAIERELKRGPHLFRYVIADDFGQPSNAFTVCGFWYIAALHSLGRRDEARELMDDMLRLRNPLGLMSEHIDPATNELWGNIPQTYAHVGLINCAFLLSRPWTDAR